MTGPLDETTAPRVIVLGTEPPRRTQPPRLPVVVVGVLLIGVLGYVVTATPSSHLEWEAGVAPQPNLNAESIISTPTGFSILGGPGPAGGVVWSTPDGMNWISRTLPRLSSRIALHRRGLMVVNRRGLTRVGSDPDDPTVPIELPDGIRIGSGSGRVGLFAGLDGLLAQTVRGDLHWAPTGREFEVVVDAADWGADSDVTPRPADVAEVAPERVRSSCSPRATRAPDVPPILVTSDRFVALIPADDPSVIWPVCEPLLWTSTDGETWEPTAHLTPFPPHAHIYDIAWRADRFVAVGGIGFNTSLALTSTDGRSWTTVEGLDAPSDVDLTSVESGGVGWIVLGAPRDGSDRIGWVSQDGECWTPLPDEVTGDGVAVGDEMLMLVEGDPANVWVGDPTNPLIPFRRCA